MRVHEPSGVWAIKLNLFMLTTEWYGTIKKQHNNKIKFKFKKKHTI